MKLKRELTKGEIFLLLFIFLAIGGLVLYGENNKNQKIKPTSSTNKIIIQQ